jgi:hypothetical protein
MQRFLLILILIGNIVIPIWAARDNNAHRSLRKTVLFILVFNFIYFMAVRYAYRGL